MISLSALELLFYYYNGCRGHKYVSLHEFIKWCEYADVKPINNPQLGEQALYGLEDVNAYLEEEG